MEGNSASSISSPSLLCQQTISDLGEDVEDEDTLISSPGLLCEETMSDLGEEVEDEDPFTSLSCYSVSEDYVALLLDKEMAFGYKSQQSLIIADWVKDARLNAITWIFKTSSAFGFGFQTAYLSVTYFDRFLSTRTIDGEKIWATQLLSVACLSLAAKMEEIKVPALSELQVEEYNFGLKSILTMELVVSRALEWRMCSITPFAFIHHFITNFVNESSPSNIVSRTVQFILAMMRETNLMDHRPSIVAAAATLVALDRGLTKQALELKINATSSCRFVEIEDLHSCYNIMQGLDIENHQLLKPILSPDLSPMRLSHTDAFENSSVISAFGNKRKRLTFDDCDQDHGAPDEKRLQ